MSRRKPEEIIYNHCVECLSADGPSIEQKKKYLSLISTKDGHELSKFFLEKKEYNKVILKASYGWAKSLIKKEKRLDDESKQVLNFLIEKKDVLIKNKVKDLYVIGAAQCLLDEIEISDPKDYFAKGKNLKSKYVINGNVDDPTLTDFQKLDYFLLQTASLKTQKEEENLSKFIEGLINDKKKIKLSVLEFLFKIYLNHKSIFKEKPNHLFLFFRLYAERFISKERSDWKGFEDNLRQFAKNMGEVEINNMREEIGQFIIFYDYSLWDRITSEQRDMLNEKIKFIVKKINLNNIHNNDVEIYLKFKYGLMPESSKNEARGYLQSAESSQYSKARYFLSEMIKEENPAEAIALYEKIINHKDEDPQLEINANSDKLEVACALYQYGLIYANGLYSYTIDWDKVDEYWGNSESVLCITMLDKVYEFDYIKKDNLSSLFIKYKADHGLVEAKHKYFDLFKNDESEKDILAIYMHDMYLLGKDDRKFDEKYQKELEKYEKRLRVGDGIEKNKKKADLIKERLEAIHHK